MTAGVVSARSLLAEADGLMDANPAIAAATDAVRPSFASGAEWMRAALGALRGEAPRGDAAFTSLGAVKYGAAAAAGAIPIAVAWATSSAWPLLLVVPSFYAAEVQGVFAFPAALDGAPRPFLASRRMVRAHGGTIRSVAIVVPIALRMLTGGLAGRGVRRSWCVGCLAVLLWYERRRKTT